MFAVRNVEVNKFWWNEYEFSPLNIVITKENACNETTTFNLRINPVLSLSPSKK